MCTCLFDGNIQCYGSMTKLHMYTIKKWELGRGHITSITHTHTHYSKHTHMHTCTRHCTHSLIPRPHPAFVAWSICTPSNKSLGGAMEHCYCTHTHYTHTYVHTLHTPTHTPASYPWLISPYQCVGEKSLVILGGTNCWIPAPEIWRLQSGCRTESCICQDKPWTVSIACT